MEILIGLGIMLAAQLVKNKITPKYGATGVHVFVFCIALAVTLVQFIAAHNPNFLAFLKQAGLLLVACIGTYEVIFKKIGDNVSSSMLSL